jgi:hypothetical protein
LLCNKAYLNFENLLEIVTNTVSHINQATIAAPTISQMAPSLLQWALRKRLRVLLDSFAISAIQKRCTQGLLKISRKLKLPLQYRKER